MRWVVHLGASSVSLQARVNKYRHTKSLALLRDGMAGASAKLFFSFFLSFFPSFLSNTGLQLLYFRL